MQWLLTWANMVAATIVANEDIMMICSASCIFTFVFCIRIEWGDGVLSVFEIKSEIHIHQTSINSKAMANRRTNNCWRSTIHEIWIPNPPLATSNPSLIQPLLHDYNVFKVVFHFLCLAHSTSLACALCSASYSYSIAISLICALKTTKNIDPIKIGQNLNFELKKEAEKNLKNVVVKCVQSLYWSRSKVE